MKKEQPNINMTLILLKLLGNFKDILMFFFMLRYILTISFLFIKIIVYCQTNNAVIPNIYYISIGSCVYSKALNDQGNILFPNKVEIISLRKGFEKDYEVYKADPAVKRKNDSLMYILHGVTWDQPEKAHLFFSQNAKIAEAISGDIYTNRLIGPFGLSTFSNGISTKKNIQNFNVVDTSKKPSVAFFDSTDFRGAKKSAVLTSRLLDKFGVTGITISSYELPISRNMIFAAVDSLWKIIQKEHKPNPKIVFYFCGHGYADAFGRRFLVPGTFTGDLNKMSFESRRLNSVFVKDLYDYLELSGYPFIMLLDCCSNNQGKAIDDNINDFYRQMAINLDGPALSKAVYQHFFQPDGDEMVIYSSILGNNSTPVPDPLEPESYTYLGPLCRRLLIANNKYKDLFYSFDNIKSCIMDKTLDQETQMPGIYCKGCGQLLIPKDSDK